MIKELKCFRTSKHIFVLYILITQQIYYNRIEYVFDIDNDFYTLIHNRNKQFENVFKQAYTLYKSGGNLI